MKKSFFVFLLSILLLFGTVCTATGQMMSSAGVKRDDVFAYSYTCYFISDDSNAVAPSEFSWINQTDYYMVKVTAVSGSTINYDSTLHMLNGSNVLGVGSMNIGSGMYSISGFNPMGVRSFYFMSSNVGMMGKMFPSSSNSPTVNDTLTMSYAGGHRSINHFSMVTVQNGVMNQSDYYFDQATGAMVEWHQHYIQNNGNLQTNGTQMMNLTSSSVWTVPELPIFIILPFLCVTVAVILTVKIKKNLVKI